MIIITIYYTEYSINKYALGLLGASYKQTTLGLKFLTLFLF